jgi:type I restriction enzyme S subunit
MIAEMRKTTMGHITQDHLKQSRIAIPNIELIDKLDNVISPILKKVVKVKEENQKLTELRDWLLPMLMNGQGRVGETPRKENYAKQRDLKAPNLGMVAEDRGE